MKTINRLSFAFLVSGLFSLGVSAFTPFITPFLSANGFSNPTISYINSLGSLSIILVTPFLASLSDKIGRKALLLFAIFVEMLAILLLPSFAKSTMSVGFIVLIQATAAVIFNIIILSLVEDNLKEKGRGFFTGLNESIFSIGVFLGPILGAFIISRTSFGYITKVSAFLFTIIFLLLLVLKEASRDRELDKLRLKQFSYKTELKHFLKNKKLRGVGILGVTMHFMTPAHYVFIPLLIVQNLQLPVAYVGFIASTSMAMGMLQFIHGWICDRFRKRKLIIIGTIISAVSILSMAYISNIWWLFIAAFLGSFGFSLWNTSTICILSAIGERRKKEGETLGTYFSLAKTGAFMSYIVSGIYVSLFGIRSIFILYGIVIFIGVVNAVRSFFGKDEVVPEPLFEVTH